MPTTAWRKSSYSDSPTGNCVEVAIGPVAVVRDSKSAGGPVLTFDVPAWHELISRCRRSG
jgi:hypothetical protein